MKVHSDLPIVVIGGGAAGTMAALFAATSGRHVILLEKTGDGGKKILISGGGRCNILPSQMEPSQFVTSSSVHTLRNILRSWPLPEQIRFFEEEAGIPLVLEKETGKLFPVSDSARLVRDQLFAMAKQRGVEIRFNAAVVDLNPKEYSSRWSVKLRSGETLAAGAVVLASGGLSVPSTGSDGAGLEMARRLGHMIHPVYPALTPLTLAPPKFADLAGVSADVKLVAPACNERTKPAATCPTAHKTSANSRYSLVSSGGFLFTHQGYSGPAVLNISHRAVLSRRSGGPLQPFYVQWSKLDAEEWEKLFVSTHGNVMSLLRRHLPVRLAERLLLEGGISGEKSLAQLRRGERQALVDLLTRFPLPWTGDEGFKKAEVTGGGVALGEVSPQTLESRHHPGLFLCGEMLDAFGPIGGYNFLWAWVTGRLAGLGAGEWRRPHGSGQK